MKHEDFRVALEAGDIRLCRKMWAAFMPHLPVPSAEQAETVMHHARTGAETISFKARAWSHRWLCERGLPSALPDKLKPSAERLYPVVAEGVGISVNSRNPYLKPAMVEVRQSMEMVVADCYANGDRDPAIVGPRMNAARDRTMRQLFGSLTTPPQR
jgi:hypothetical protein